MALSLKYCLAKFIDRFSVSVYCAVLYLCCSVVPATLLYSTQLDLRAYGEKAVSDDVGRGGRAEVGQCSVLRGHDSRGVGHSH